MRLLLIPLLCAMVMGCSSEDAGGTGTGGGPDSGGAGAGGGSGGGGGGGNGSGTDGGGTGGNVAGDSTKYGQDGTDTWTQQTLTVTRANNSTFQVVAYVPKSAGAHPVVMLSSGLMQTAAGYGPYGKRLATWGVLAILRDDPGIGAQTPAVVDDVTYLINTWLPAQNADAASPLHGLVDVSSVGLAGHSRGGQVSLLAAEGALKGKLKGVFTLDPVDGSMSGAQARTALAQIGVPTGFIGETTDSGGGAGGMACAPAADNYQVLYAAASSPSVALTAVEADHTQFEDAQNCTFCSLCTAGKADGAKVLTYSVKYLTAFFARELLGDSAVGAQLGATADVQAGLVTVENK